MASPLAYTNLPDEGGVTYTNTQPTFEQLDAVSGRGNLMGRAALSALYGVAAGRQANDVLSAEFAGDEARKKSALRAHDELVARAAYEAPNQDLRKIGGVGDAVDFVRGAAGNAAVTMIPSIVGAALFRGRGPVGKAAAFGGAYAPAYVMERDEALSSQYQDPEQMKASAEERDLAATAKGGINAALESIVPAGLGGSLLRKPAGSFLGHIGRNALTEGATEAAQQVVGFGAQKYLDPNKELDPWDVANAAAAGVAGGGGMSAAMRGPAHAVQAVLGKAPRPSMPEIKNPFQRGDAAVDDGPVDLPPDTGGGGDAAPADTMLGKVAGLGQAVNDRFGDDIAAAGDKAVKAAGTAKDFVSETVGRMTEAVKTAENPGDFLNKVFGGNIEDEAAADMTGEPNLALKGLTFEETEANIARDDEQRIARAARYADELLNDPATPEQIKQRVAAMGGDYTNPDNQSFVARTLVAQRGGEKVMKAAKDLVDLGKSAFATGAKAASAAKKAAGDAAIDAQERIIKKNLQSATPAEQAAFNKVIFDNLTDEAKASTFVRAQLSQVTNVLMSFAAKTGDITAKDLPTLTKLANAMSLFKDPDALAAQLVEYGAIPRDTDSFLGRVKSIQNARTDVKQPNSFLYMSLTPEAMETLTGPMLQHLAQLVDEFSLQDAAGKGDQILEGLAQAFGSPESARAVLDFYAKQNRANVRFDPNEGEDARPRSSDDIGDADGIEGFGTLSEQDAKELVPRFRHPNINRPFLRGRDDAASDAELARGGDLAQRVSMAEYVRSSNESAVFFAGDMRRDLMKRLNNNLSRDAESVREAIKILEAHIEDAEAGNGDWRSYSEAKELLKNLKSTKTEDRSAVVKLQREELKAIDSAIEKAKRAGKDPDEAVLELYDVVMAMPDQFRASDHQLTGFRKLLGKTSKRKTKAENEAIRKTGVKFLINGQEVAVSLESMVTESPIHGSVRERLLESLALVGARADEMPKIPNDAIVKRNYFGKDRHLTWGRLMGMGANPDVKSKARKQFETDPAKEAIKAELDKVNASNLREYMDNLPKDVDALSAGAGLLSRIEGQIEAAKEQMEESPSKAVGDRIRNLSSKRRVLKTYLNEILDADYPVSHEAIMDNLESELQAGGIVNKEGQKTEYANILFKEELIQTYRDRAKAVKGTSLADDALAKADELTIELDKDLSKLQDFQRMDLMDRPSARSKGVGSTAPKKAMSNEDIQTELADARAELERVQNADLESFRALAANESDSFLVRQNLSQEKLAKAKEAAIAHAQDMVSRWERHAAGQKKPKAGPNPAASSRETAKKVNDSQALSPDAITALHDVAVKENWSRLDTPAKVLKFAAMAAKAREQLKKIPELERTDEQDELRYQLNDMFNQNKGAAFDWESLWDGLDPTDAQKAQLEDIVRPKAEPGTARQFSDTRVRKNSFIGAKADPEGEGDAADLLGVGVPADFVWRELGWFRGPDGKLRKEVRSPVLRQRVRALAKAIAAGSREATTIRDLIEGIPQFENYLDTLGGLRVDPADDVVEMMGSIGAFSDGQGFMGPGIGLSRMHAEAEARISAFRSGEGLKKLKEVAGRIADQQMASLGYIELEMEQVFAELEKEYPIPDIEDRVADILADTIVHELQHAFQYVEGFENGGTAATAVVATYGDVEGYIAAVKNGDSATAESIAEQAFEQLRVEVGPDGDVEAKAHELYASITGEVEANDVAARMKLSDEEAVHVKPALMDAERRFVRSLLLTEALHTVRGMGNRQSTNKNAQRASTMKPKRGRPGKIDRQAVIDEIIRTRGKDVKVAVDKLHSALGGSGQYTYNRKTGRRLIEVAINAIDPIGTARHEAMHDFFQFLGENEATRAVARTLKEVMGSKEVMDKLKDLLQGHKDALEQLNDPEERVAYAYQFWAAGALDLGPKSTGIFRTITNFLRDMFGIVTKEQRAVDILNAFHDGDFSNVSTVREALFDQAERDGATFWEKMNHMAPALNKAVLAISSAAPDRLRRFENDSLNALADKFFTDGGKQGFIQNRFQQEGVWSNKLEAAFAGTTAEERRIALEQLQSMKPVSPLAKKLAEFNSEMYDYMSAAGVKTFDRNQKKWVPIRRVNNYFARSWDGDAIARNRSDFVQLLISEGGLSLGAAEKVADKLINGREERLTPQEQSILGFTPYAVHTAERVFGFIKPGNADEFAKFQKKDITDIMSNYVQQAVYRAEYARSFDNDGRVISDLIAASGITDKDELTAISNTVQAMEGSLDPDKWSSSTKELMSVMMTAQNVILLPLAIVSQVVDPIILAARTGDLRDAGTAYVNGIKRLWNTVSKNGKKVDGEDLAYILGVVSENSTLQAMGMTASTTRMSKRMEEINRKFFRYNGMQGWNNTMRITATAAAERYIIANKDNAEALAELGITPGDVKMSTVYVPDGKGKLVEKHSLDVSSREVQQAMFKMVDQSVLRPSAANRPVWMSDPRFLLVGHLKQFTFAMHNVVLKRANKQLENGNAKPWLILALAAPAVLAADMAKFALTGDMPTSWGFFDYLSHAVNRSGLLGIGDFSTELFSGVGQGKLPGEGLLGPSFEHVAEILRWIGGDPRTGFEDVIDRTVPFAKYA